jgi:hypothetical protein
MLKNTLAPGRTVAIVPPLYPLILLTLLLCLSGSVWEDCIMNIDLNESPGEPNEVVAHHNGSRAREEKPQPLSWGFSNRHRAR